MWLLSTDRAELHYFFSPMDVSDGYAILSHVWGKEEQSFREVQEIVKRCTAEGKNPRDHVSEKIRRCCELAESHGCKWIWNDTCCIDKSSSVELSEAINSMFRYYSMSRICYAYLADVPTAAAFIPVLQPQSWDPESPFAFSMWHRRGWTLQELIAPRLVLFLSRDWVSLGTKFDLARELEGATRIPSSVFTLDRSVNDFSIAQRMSWASRRKTTREEDAAYSLLGLFDIHMPVIYGEGVNAFQRLQEEIMRRSTDTTLFAWSYQYTSRSSSSSPQQGGTSGSLFASSPKRFKSRGATCIELSKRNTHPVQCSVRNCDSLPFLDYWENISCNKTPEGIMAHIPLIKLSQGGLYAADFGWSDQGYRLLLILGRRARHRQGASSGHSAFVVKCLAGHSKHCLSPHSVLDPEAVAMVAGKPGASWKWMDVLLLEYTSEETSLPLIPKFNYSTLAPFHLSETNTYRVASSCRRPSVPGYQYEMYLESVQNVPFPWSGSPPAIFRFSFWFLHPYYRHVADKLGSTDVLVGQCLPSDTLWANARNAGGTEESDHSCSEDHVGSWPDNQRCFTSTTSEGFRFHLVLSFLSSPSQWSAVPQLEVTIATTPRCALCGLMWESHEDDDSEQAVWSMTMINALLAMSTSHMENRNSHGAEDSDNIPSAFAVARSEDSYHSPRSPVNQSTTASVHHAASESLKLDKPDRFADSWEHS